MDVKRGNSIVKSLHNLLLTALCVAVGVMVLTGCGDSPKKAVKTDGGDSPKKVVKTDDDDSPAAVVKKWHAAISAGDQAEADKYVTGAKSERFNKRMIKNIRGFVEDAKDTGGLGAHARKELESWKGLTFKETASSGDSATVTASSNGETIRFTLQKVNGKWKIDTAKGFK